MKKVGSKMKLRLVNTHEELEAEVITDPKLALRRKDTGEIISIGETFGIPTEYAQQLGLPSRPPSQKYEIMDASKDERRIFDENGIMLVDPDDLGI